LSDGILLVAREQVRGTGTVWIKSHRSAAREGDERKVLKQMRTLRTEGVSFRQITARLHEQPVPPRSGRVLACIYGEQDSGA
jgi:hypothetical protein